MSLSVHCFLNIPLFISHFGHSIYVSFTFILLIHVFFDTGERSVQNTVAKPIVHKGYGTRYCDRKHVGNWLAWFWISQHKFQNNILGTG